MTELEIRKGMKILGNVKTGLDVCAGIGLGCIGIIVFVTSVSKSGIAQEQSFDTGICQITEVITLELLK